LRSEAGQRGSEAGCAGPGGPPGRVRVGGGVENNLQTMTRINVAISSKIQKMSRQYSKLDGSRSDYRLCLVLYFGVLATLGGAILYRRLSQGHEGPWFNDLFVLAIIALIFQTGISLMLGSVVRRASTKIVCYSLAAASFALLFVLPVAIKWMRGD
jgi:hypothetical protein